MNPDLTEAVHKLTWPRFAPNPASEHPNVTRPIVAPPLLVELENAIRGTLGRDASSKVSSAFERNILDGDALFEFMKITEQIRTWCRLAGIRPVKNAVVDLEAWHAAFAGSAAFYLDQLYEWERVILGKLDPLKLVELVEDCPVCEARVWFDADGTQHPRPLVIQYRRSDPHGTVGGWCRSEQCDAVWEDLAAIRVLRAQIGDDSSALLALLLNPAYTEGV